MPVKSIQHIADNLPELLMLIAEYLNPSDVAHWMATCKTFAYKLEPCLWRHLTIRNEAPPKDALLRNGSHILTIAIHKDGFDQNFIKALAQDIRALDQPFSKLHCLALGPFPLNAGPRHIIAQMVVDIARQSHLTLTTMTLPPSMLTIDSRLDSLVQDVLPTRLPNLSHLTIGKGGPVPWTRTLPFLVRCFQHPRLISLQCGFSISDRNCSLQKLLAVLDDVVQSKEGTGASCIKDLGLPSPDTGYKGQVLVPFLRVHGPSLESMWIPSIASDMDNQLLEKTVEESCPSLRHLGVVWSRRQPVKCSAIAAIIRGCKPAGLESIHLTGIDQQQRAVATEMKEIVESLVSHHAMALQELDLVKCVIQSEQQYWILERCPNLRRLWIQPQATRSPRSFTIYVHECNNDWACLEMKELCLTYGLDWQLFHGQLGKSLDKQALSASVRLYKQIGRLVQLEDLAIGFTAQNHSERSCYEHDLTLQKGWLAELVGLKKLRRLYVCKNLWKRMGQEEVEFMHQNWPLLQRVSFECEAWALNKIRNAPHWEWLREKRPWLQLAWV
ncbi:hypothetical protein BGX31_008025 [Mortierella sp. GBA43]|nr:hypothetical protein BGX31_008025 [Mortierella sp. GBA43]